jgi:hypothetical protein
MPSLKEIQDQTMQVEVPLGGLIVKVDFYPTRFTGKLQKQLNAQARSAQAAIDAGEEPSEEDTESTAVLLTEICAGWDITDDKGKPCPITVPFLVDSLGYFGMNKIGFAVIGAIRPNA